MNVSHQPCVCIARCNHCICGALPPARRTVVHPTVDELLTDPKVRERYEQTLAALNAKAKRRAALDELVAIAQAMGDYE